MAERMPITPEGYRKLEEELKRLKNVERPVIIKAIEEARSHGDLSENAEYKYAKEKQFLNDKKIAEIEAQMGNSEIIDPSKLSGDTVAFGCAMKLVNCETGEETLYRIVGEGEANSREGRISIMSPMARCLLGKKAGDVVEVVTPKGTREYEVKEVRY